MASTANMTSNTVNKIDTAGRHWAVQHFVTPRSSSVLFSMLSTIWVFVMGLLMWRKGRRERADEIVS